MQKRFAPYVLIAAGVLLLAASFAYWRFTEAVVNPEEAVLPETVAGLPLSRASYGAAPLLFSVR